MELEEKLSELEKLQNRISQLEEELTYYKEYRMMDKETLTWLAHNIDLDKNSKRQFLIY